MIMVSLSTVMVLIMLLRIFTVFHRLYVNLLAKHPGPPFAAASRLYRMYFDVYLGGKWVDHLHKLHAFYGPVVRIGPNELSFYDPLAYGDIYASGNSMSKDPHLYRCFAIDDCAFATLNTQQALKVRQPLTPFFSRRAILRLEKVIQSHVDKLVDRLSDYELTKHPANLHRAFRSTSLDIISAYCFSSSPNTLDTPDFNHEFITTFEPTMSIFWVFKHFPLIRRLLLALPYWIAVRLNPDSKAMLDHRAAMLKQIDQVINATVSLGDADHPTIYHNLLAYVTQEGYDRSRIRKILQDEGLLLRFAGSDTVGTTCSVATTYLLRDKAVLNRLVEELKAAWPDSEERIGFETLEKLPYLTAVIKEALRMSPGAPTPLTRVVGSHGAQISGLFIPPATVVSEGTTLIHQNADVFSDPARFNPDRWLDSVNSGKLEKFLVAFSRGPRSCLGINLAWCELYLILGNVFRKLDLHEDETQLADLRYRDYFIPVYNGTKLHAYVKVRDS